MTIYLYCFILSVFCFNLSVRTGNRIISFLFLIISFIIPSLLSGLRDDTIGTDLQLYGIRCWNDCSNLKTLSDLFEYSFLSNIEIGYALFNFLIAKITRDLHSFLFIRQLVISIVFYIIAYRLKKSIYPNFIIVGYLLTLFVPSFNLLRQSMAIAFFFLAFYLYFIRGKKILPIIVVLFAMLFHNSIVFVVFIPLIYRIVNNNSNKKIYIIAISSTVLVFSAFKSILMKLLNSGFLSNKYENYMSQVGYSSHKSDIALFLLIFCLLMYYKTRYKILDTKNYNFIMVSTFAAICLLFLGDVTEVANRVAVYYTIPLFFIFSQVSLPRKKMKLLYCSVIFAMFAVWLYSASLGFSDCIPYTSKILGVTK